MLACHTSLNGENVSKESVFIASKEAQKFHYFILNVIQIRLHDDFQFNALEMRYGCDIKALFTQRPIGTAWEANIASECNTHFAKCMKYS